MEENKIYYQRNLPHYQPLHSSFLITFRLAGSIPNKVIIKLKEEYQFLEKQIKTLIDPKDKKRELDDHCKRYFKRFDDFLDKRKDGPMWLKEERVTQIVVDAIHFRDRKEYELIAYCVMPNHVHLVVTVERSDTSLYKILQSLKDYTARECNKILHRSSAFWQHESYDHVIRDDKELSKIIDYVINNPVKAGLVRDKKIWKWSYCKYEM